MNSRLELEAEHARQMAHGLPISLVLCLWGTVFIVPEEIEPLSRE